MIRRSRRRRPCADNRCLNENLDLALICLRRANEVIGKSLKDIMDSNGRGHGRRLCACSRRCGEGATGGKYCREAPTGIRREIGSNQEGESGGRHSVTTTL